MGGTYDADTRVMCQIENILPRGQNIKKSRGDVVARKPETHNPPSFIMQS